MKLYVCHSAQAVSLSHLFAGHREFAIDKTKFPKLGPDDSWVSQKKYLIQFRSLIVQLLYGNGRFVRLEGLPVHRAHGFSGAASSCFLV
jgi:hypothetical protein